MVTICNDSNGCCSFDQNNRLSSIQYYFFCCCCLFSSLLHGKFYIFFVSSVLFVVNMCICPMSTLTKAGDLYASTHLRQLLLLLPLSLPILMKTEIFISIHFYFRSSKVISHRSICSKPFRLYSPKKRWEIIFVCDLFLYVLLCTHTHTLTPCTHIRDSYRPLSLWKMMNIEHHLPFCANENR